MLIDIEFRVLILGYFIFTVEHWLKHGEVTEPPRLFIPRRSIWLHHSGLRLSGWRMHAIILFLEIFLVVPSIYWGFTLKTIIWDIGALISLTIVSSILFVFEWLNERDRIKQQSSSLPKLQKFAQKPSFLD